ncbi:aldehyde dehydrogenase family protein [Agrococcus sp. ARC_14]|uniref:aldehyde dehydrogenase family protein n=1 Tax=Agrococcus sp. ARC_14 TaxID=2919927 RepID=UPI001F06D871|nr:aldehyde dehydrogenase family protein [Agrococcus sp. ARC_14]
MTTTAPRLIRPYIDGEVTGDGELIERRAPGTNAHVSNIVATERHDVERAIRAARTSFDDGRWADTTGFHRAAVLNRLADLIDRDAELLARLDAEEGGKPIRIARGDVGGAASLCRYAAALALTQHGDSYTNNGPDFTGIIMKQPIGVVSLVIPWNFPALILCQKLPFALAAGCSAVIKPSEFTSASAMHIAHLCSEAGVPDGVVNVVTGAGDVGQLLNESPLIDMVSFTGSTATGKKVMQAAAGTMKKLSLELGGKAASVVFDDADLEDAIAGVTFGVTFNNGECCVSQARLIVQDGIADELLAGVAERMRQVRVGQPLDEATDVGAMIHAQHREKVLDLVAGAGAAGAEITLGGGALQGGELGDGQFVEATIIDGVRPGLEVFSQEIFGPVLTVTRFGDDAEGISLANRVSYGLSNSVWSKNIDRVLTAAKEIRSGTVYANTAIDGPPQMPIGGFKASGIGREMGEAGFEEFLETKSVNIRTGRRAGSFMIPGTRA